MGLLDAVIAFMYSIFGYSYDLVIISFVAPYHLSVIENFPPPDGASSQLFIHSAGGVMSAGCRRMQNSPSFVGYQAWSFVRAKYPRFAMEYLAA